MVGEGLALWPTSYTDRKHRAVGKAVATRGGVVTVTRTRDPAGGQEAHRCLWTQQERRVMSFSPHGGCGAPTGALTELRLDMGSLCDDTGGWRGDAPSTAPRPSGSRASPGTRTRASDGF